MKPIQLTYTKPLITRAVRAYWSQQVGILLPIVTLAMAVLAIYLIVSGDRSWLVGAVSVAVFLAIATMISIYVVHLRRSTKKLDAMGEMSATLTMDHDHLRMESGAGAAELPWASIVTARKYNDFWLVHLENAAFFTIPTVGLADSDRELISKRLEALVSAPKRAA